MTTAVAEPPPSADVDQDSATPAAGSQHTKPSGITDKTWQSLAPKGKRFIHGYLEHGNALTAYEDAGYVADKGTGSGIKHQRNAYSVLRGIKVRRALVEHAEARSVLEQDRDNCTRDYIRSELERLKRKAEDKHDYANAIRAVELEGRMFAYFSDAVQVDVAARREYSEAEEAEGRHLARLRLEEMGEVPDEVLVEGVQVQVQVERERGKDGKYVGGKQEATGRRPNGDDNKEPRQEKSQELSLTPEGNAGKNEGEKGTS